MTGISWTRRPRCNGADALDKDAPKDVKRNKAGERPKKELIIESEIGRILGKEPYWIKGDHAGSDAEPGVSTRRSLRPVTSTDQI
jgi:hypothetical protein